MLNQALDLLFPPQCLSCKALVPSNGALCLECWKEVRFITEPHCHRCGLPFEYALGPEALCGECLKEEPPFAGARAVFVYGEASRALVLAFKYQDQTQLAPVYGAWLAKAGKEVIAASEIVVPVPLHWRRFIGRRYNQAALLASALGRQARLPVLQDALKRTRPTLQQTGLTRRQREDNICGAFAVNPKQAANLKGKRVLLIDDVMTTGVTIAQCARILLKAGAKEVNVLTLARVAD